MCGDYHTHDMQATGLVLYALAGGREKFTRLLEEFFCVGCPRTFAEARPMHHDHFEGMNNESDMETPYCWLWVGRSDRMAEVIDLIRRCRFTTGEGGCPGTTIPAR